MLRRDFALGLATLAAGFGLGHAQAREAIVPFDESVAPGTIVVKTAARQLFLVTGYGSAIRYPVAVGRAGKQWAGYAAVAGKYVSPAWSPPDEIRRDNPKLPRVIPGGAKGNPMGMRALVLDRGQYAIHGTNQPGSIGHFASYGCIRMHNSDIVDLYERVAVGTPVLVVQ